jgi:hypothetical protein
MNRQSFGSAHRRKCKTVPMCTEWKLEEGFLVGSLAPTTMARSPTLPRAIVVSWGLYANVFSPPPEKKKKKKKKRSGTPPRSRETLSLVEGLK